MDSRDGPISLREYLEFRIASVDQRVEQRIQLAERAVSIALDGANAAMDKAETATDKRFEGVNEFRSALNDVVTRLMPRTESDQRHGAISEKIDILNSRLTRIEGAGMGVKGAWAVIAAVLGITLAGVGTVIALIR